jgi:hypothetical protein
MSQTADLACTYAALILDDGGADVSVSFLKEEEEENGREKRGKKRRLPIDRRWLPLSLLSPLRFHAAKCAVLPVSFSTERPMATVKP